MIEDFPNLCVCCLSHELWVKVDDGVGFDTTEQEKAFCYENEVDDEEKGKNYGLTNVNKRIKLYFGQEYGLKITSSPGKGTRTDVILPLNSYET